MSRDTKLWIAALAILGFIVAPGAGAAGEDDTRDGLPLIYENDFEDGIDGWTMTDPKAWQHLKQEDGNHALALTSKSEYEPPVRSPLNIAGIEGFSVSDFVIEVDLEQTGREYGHRDMCIFFGYQSPAHFYYVHIATKSDDHANSIFIVNGQPRLSIAKERTGGTDWTTGYHKIRIKRVTSSGLIEVYFDDMDKPIMSTVDMTFLGGGVGFGSFDDTGNVDNVKIWGKKGLASEDGSESK